MWVHLLSWEKCTHWSGVWGISSWDTPCTRHGASVPWHLVWWSIDLEATDPWVYFWPRALLWLLRRLGGWDWGLDPCLFLRPVRGVILPIVFYEAPCWASSLCSNTILEELDSVLASAARIAFRLERTWHVCGSKFAWTRMERNAFQFKKGFYLSSVFLFSLFETIFWHSFVSCDY